MELPSPRYAFHPWLPQRLGFVPLLGITAKRLAKLIRIGDDYTLMSARKRTTLYREGQGVLHDGVPGAFVEIGVHRGGSSIILAGLIDADAGRSLHLFDRWGDLPEPSLEDGLKKTEYSRNNIPEKLEALKVDDPLVATKKVLEQNLGFRRAEYHQGWYDDTLPNYNGGPIAFASIDCDYYDSVVLALDFVKRHASPDCRIVLDDYDDWPGAKQAGDEFVARNGIALTRTGLGAAVIRL